MPPVANARRWVGGCVGSCCWFEICCCCCWWWLLTVGRLPVKMGRGVEVCSSAAAAAAAAGAGGAAEPPLEASSASHMLRWDSSCLSTISACSGAAGRSSCGVAQSSDQVLRLLGRLNSKLVVPMRFLSIEGLNALHAEPRNTHTTLRKRIDEVIWEATWSFSRSRCSCLATGPW